MGAFQLTKMVNMDIFFPTQRNFFWDDVFPSGSGSRHWHSGRGGFVNNIVLDIEFSFLVPLASTAEIPRSHCQWRPFGRRPQTSRRHTRRI